MGCDPPPVGALQGSESLEEVDPVVRAVLAGMAAQEDELRLEGIPGVGRPVHEARPRPPYADRRAEGIALLHEEREADAEGKEELEKAPTRDRHELAQQPEEDM